MKMDQFLPRAKRQAKKEQTIFKKEQIFRE